MVDANIPDIALEPDKTVRKVTFIVYCYIALEPDRIVRKVTLIMLSMKSL